MGLTTNRANKMTNMVMSIASNIHDSKVTARKLDQVTFPNSIQIDSTVTQKRNAAEINFNATNDGNKNTGGVTNSQYGGLKIRYGKESWQSGQRSGQGFKSKSSTG